MSDPATPSWQDLRARYPAALLTTMWQLFQGGGRLEVSREELAGRGNFAAEDLDRLLVEAVRERWLERRDRLVCPGCRNVVPTAPPEGTRCESCHGDFVDLGDPETEAIYFRRDPLPRLVDWALTLHGMNTRGDWQEKLAWRMALAYGKAVPVAIYKYGMVRPGVLFRWRQRQLRQQVAGRIRELSRQADLAGYRPEPDVIAHSFGTWLLGHALVANQGLRVGRVILTGSILRPDFSWQELIDGGQVEAVLNHYGTADVPVAITHYFIPDSGPAGRRGFDRPGALNVEARGFGHSTFFQDQLDSCFQNVWAPFLQAQPINSSQPATSWRPRPWPLRYALGRLAAILFATAVLGSTVGAFAFGLGPFFAWLGKVFS